ncbi:MAG: tetratricopeptide repeat protein [Vicinamibacterales bacterium]
MASNTGARTLRQLVRQYAGELTTPDGIVGRTLVIVVVASMLSTAAVVLTQAYRHRRAERAARSFEQGRAELAAGRAEAAASLRESVALEPTARLPRLELARALLASGRTQEAASHLRDVLRDDPMNGPANLVLARVQRARGQLADAQTSYYRAIYGLWAPDEQQARVDTRLELIELLTKTASAERVRSEFIQLAEAFPGDLPLQLRVGRSLLAAGDVDDAARVFRRVTERFADPGSAFADLADAELARHEYIAAFEAATRALARNPADKASAERRTLAAAVLALDPTQPRLSAGERTKRLGRLLGAARERLVACDGATPASADSDVMPMLDRWLASSRGQQLEEADLGMALLGAASRRVAERCPPGTAPDAVDLVLRGAVRSSRP